VIESWGNALRFVFVFVSICLAVRTVVGPIPWDQLAYLFKLGG